MTAVGQSIAFGDLLARLYHVCVDVCVVTVVGQAIPCLCGHVCVVTVVGQTIPCLCGHACVVTDVCVDMCVW